MEKKLYFRTVFLQNKFLLFFFIYFLGKVRGFFILIFVNINENRTIGMQILIDSFHNFFHSLLFFGVAEMRRQIFFLRFFALNLNFIIKK